MVIFHHGWNSQPCGNVIILIFFKSRKTSLFTTIEIPNCGERWHKINLKIKLLVLGFIPIISEVFFTVENSNCGKRCLKNK